MKINELIKKIEERFPLFIQEEYDNTGSQIIFTDEEIKGIYICLDADMNTISDAVKNKCNLIISHHPIIFKPVKNITSNDSRSKSIIKLIDERLSLYSIHTNFDKIMFSYMSDITGFSGGELLLKKGLLNDKEIGYGSFVDLFEIMSFNSVMTHIKRGLNLEYLMYSGNIDKKIKTIAFINGSGGSSIEKIINLYKPDCIVTGDVGYHNMKYGLENDICIIDAGHFGTENIFKKLLAESVRDIISVDMQNVNILISEIEQNPFKIYV